jgi:hypothetical protein
MTIRAKLYAAIAMTVLGPVVTIAAALGAMDALGDRFDEVSDRAARQALALELKYQVTDLNGWQTAYGYDGGRSRPQFVQAREQVEATLARARRELTDRREAQLPARLRGGRDAFLALADERRDARRRLVAVGLGAAALIVILLVTAQDVARAALEARGDARPGSGPAPGPR